MDPVNNASTMARLSWITLTFWRQKTSRISFNSERYDGGGDPRRYSNDDLIKTRSSCLIITIADPMPMGNDTCIRNDMCALKSRDSSVQCQPRNDRSPRHLQSWRCAKRERTHCIHFSTAVDPSANSGNNTPLAYSSCSATAAGSQTQCANIAQMQETAWRPNVGNCTV
eukprot:800458-Pyramimonas_sp.AAC.1